MFWLWPRQSGKSFGVSLGSILDAAGEQPSPWVWLSSGERMSKALIETASIHARAIGKAAEVLEEDFDVEDFQCTAHVIRLKGTKTTITALPANPATARGHSANVWLDEFATQKASRAIWSALFPTITRGFRIVTTTTPLGKQNKAYDLYTDWTKLAAGGDTDYGVQKLNIYDCVKQGLRLYDHKGQPSTPESLRVALGDEEAWEQEYLCEFLDEATAYLTFEQITACEDAELVVAPSWSSALVQAAIEAHRVYLRTKSDEPLAAGRVLDELPSGDLYLGMDIARRRHLTVIWLLEREDTMLKSVTVLPLDKLPFRVQKDVLFSLLRAPNLRRACLDETGIGMQLAEEAREHFGEWKVEGVTFSAANKEAMAGGLKPRVEDRAVTIPADNAIRNSLHSIKRVQTTTGHFRYDVARDETNEHGDYFWALALAVQAAEGGPAWTLEGAETTGEKRAYAGLGGYTGFSASGGFGPSVPRGY
ncbi:MAG: terminase large subunit domain-containing protein [Acidobacteriota bacterium]